MESFSKIRRGKKIPLCRKILIFMDDIYMASSNASDLRKAEKELIRFCEEEIGLEIKPDWTLIDTENATLDAMGFRINKRYIKMRRINYLRTKRSMMKFDKHSTFKNAKTLVTRTTNIKYSDSYHFRKKYHWKKKSREARRMISHEGKIYNKAAESIDNYRWQYRLLPNSTECRRD